MKPLDTLSALVLEHNKIAEQITHVIGRPAQLGHVGEYLASSLFDVELAPAANNRLVDGHFRGGLLKGRSVDVKMYPVRENVLDMHETAIPDFFLVFAGPKGSAVSSKKKGRPWVIDGIYLFDAAAISAMLRAAGRRPGTGTSVAQSHWDVAEVYPRHECTLLDISEEHLAWLPSFGREVATR